MQPLTRYVYFFAVSLFLISCLSQASAQTRGVVAEVLHAAGYTYLQLTEGDVSTWVAIPETDIAKGEEVVALDGMKMVDFHAKSLNRTFPSIIFASGVSRTQAVTAATTESPVADPFAAAVAKEQQAPPLTQQPVLGGESGGSSGAVVPYTGVAITKADGANGYTVGEIFARAEELAGTTVRVRGKVVKISPNIMGRNWVHLQDGTGDPMQNSHDLVVTTSQTATPEAVITVEGKLAANRDFGAGYSYDAIVEEATIVQ